MEIIVKGIDEIDDAYYNPRVELQAGDPRYERLKKSIQEFGLIDPLVWNKRTNRLVGGHQRRAILKDLGYEEVTLSVVDLDEDKEKALNLALNKTGGDWDKQALADLLQELDAAAIDIEVTGFDETDLDRLVGELEAESRRNGSFLESFLNDDEDEEPLPFGDTDDTDEDDTDDDDEENGEYVKLTYPVTLDQREIVLEAIKQAKLQLDAETSPEAIVAICGDFLKRWGKQE